MKGPTMHKDPEPQQTGSDAEEAESMEDAQEQAGREREDEGGYQ